MGEVDEAFLDVTTAIKGALRKRDPAPAKAKAAPARGTSVRGHGGRLGGYSIKHLRVAKRFSDRD